VGRQAQLSSREDTGGEGPALGMTSAIPYLTLAVPPTGDMVSTSGWAGDAHMASQPGPTDILWTGPQDQTNRIPLLELVGNIPKHD
jgi:hypothetical protein